MQMHIQAPDRPADAPKAKLQGHVQQSVYAAVNGHAQAIVVGNSETGRTQR